MKDWWQRLRMATELASRSYRMRRAIALRLVDETAGLDWLAIAEGAIASLSRA